MKTYVLTVSKNFMKGHPREGQPTHFRDKICGSKKIHTIRLNYGYWNAVAQEINRGKGVLSIRQWAGQPYKSKQIEFLELKKLGIQKFQTDENGVILIDGFYTTVDYELIATNDGLSYIDFNDWFPLDRPIDNGVIIHFTDFRYDI